MKDDIIQIPCRHQKRSRCFPSVLDTVEEMERMIVLEEKFSACSHVS